jgi:hypothetical protein
MKYLTLLLLPGCIADLPRAPSPDTVYQPPEVVITWSLEPTPRQRWIDYFISQGMGYDEAVENAELMVRK